MKLFTLIFALTVMSCDATADVSCVQTSTITTCSNGMSAYQLGNMTQYNMPNGEGLTVWNSNVNRYQEVQPIQPIAPIPPITPVPSFRVFEPFN